MADHQKMEALKKVYAEMILNTAKEAAARALDSERKALHIHHDLCNTKDEAIRMLLRFKQLIDVKKTEAERTALSQQNRIKELDAQLNETEGVIIDLRAEIRSARERLEEMKSIHMLHSNGLSQNKHTHQENSDNSDVTEQFRCSSQCGKSYNPAKEITTSGPNSTSIIVGNKEPESFRNGYTHRIQEIERNLTDKKSISEQKELNINVDEKNSEKCAQLEVDTENKDIKNINESEAFSINNRVSKDQTVKRLPKRVGYLQLNHKLSRFGREKLNLKDKYSGNDAKLMETSENSASTLRRSIRKRKVRCWDEISSLFKSRASLSHCKKHLVNDGVKFEETKSEDTNVASDPLVEKHESAAKESDGVACNTYNNRCLKYTFSRRHKKVLSSKSDNYSSHGNSCNHENKKPDLIEDSSSDSPNMMDIACQLISLSANRSW
ncbi:hypothetical protein HanRHA438_Chr14g0663881 [Helianthus annuus]|uniref:Uncharacterized protein n=2 Tax=Helianthus annuus TaxID=4232 RepID=A0A251SIY8_HELAN|nr:uncharacterized protein LOC110903982 isoform X1 [Helianthus annuus]KAF5769872.1 hypothetical protein HanXRQr2_Chr14g0653211 [Helianthus annuus]KAJ0464823.1 hypothetical protein HanHA300_Chr14g0531581 [Helianthus annuus]KAJ0486417.1 hypothetical protein HanHA89_Chr14g0579421 [Helianthus annuus]KAJ0656974.1 hypothetical protein HanLR1_Chr14g0541891 [Helianthus annuus]KAJ0660565.1 hypothetical protein HanOQP8_Chr14g0539161 [Helianthus annuus]